MGWLMLMFCLLFLLLQYCQVNYASSLSYFSSSSVSLCHPDQSLALLQFKNIFSISEVASLGCDDNGYPKIESWKEATDCCKWDGVMCDLVTGHVIGLDLSCSQLYGPIPPNSSLFHLIHLRSLNLAHNSFDYCDIPPKFGRFARMTHLNLSSSSFFGQVPSVISHLSNLVSFDLSGNLDLSLEKSVWKGLVRNLTKLRELFLNEVNMSSVGPSSLMNLSSIFTFLSLNDCGLSGKFLDKVFLSLPNLQMLDLGLNEGLTGSLPKSNWTNPLKHLNLGWTNFSGELPESIGDLKSLMTLNLHQCNLKGSIPTSLETLMQITYLDLSHNHFTGSISVWLGNLTQTTFLDLSMNNLNGSIQESLGNLTRIYHLDLSSNKFNGQILSSLSNLKALTYLNLATNNFSGRIPNVFTDLTLLTEVDLYSNLLEGTLPSSLFTLPALEYLDLSNNQLIGLIDDEFQHNNSLKTLSLHNNKLYGSIPKSISKLVNLNQLDISSNNLSGIVNFEMFLELKNLEYLDLSFNNISFSIDNDVNYTLPSLHKLKSSSCNISEFPNFLRNIENLRQLDLSNNWIYGQIPKWMYDVGNALSYLDLSANLLQGSLPVPPPFMKVLLISNNNLTGEIPFLICNVSSLWVLDISYNRMSGIIPQCLGNISDYLSVLDLRSNSFHGTIPQTFAKCDSLRTLNFNGNYLRGPLPRSLVNCRSLEILDHGNNKINDSFPLWLEALPNLRVLVLKSNRFHGPVANSKSEFSFPNLRILDLSYNEFNSLLPTNYFENFKAMMMAGEGESKLQYMGEQYYQDSVAVTMKGLEVELVTILTTFTTIDLSSNKFQGRVPEVLESLNFLRLLNLSHNSLSGPIPSSLGNLKVLESLDLSSNKLTGEIPMQLTGLTFLAVLNISQNQLMGPIPQGKQFNTFQNDSYGGNLGLCGFPLSNKCTTDEPSPPPPPSVFQEDNDSEFVSGFGWKVVLLGYGCGMVFGLAMGCLVFKARKPQWLIRLIEEEQHRMVRRSNRRRRGRRN